MHIAVFFKHIGHYHLARLEAAFYACSWKGWNFTAIQVIDQTHQHPWGEFGQKVLFPIRTLLPIDSTPNVAIRSADAPIPSSLLFDLLDVVKPDVLAIPGWGFPISRAALNWSKQHQIPAILMSESKRDDEPRIWWKEWLKSKLYVCKYDSALVGGSKHKDYLIQLGFPAERIFLGYDAVDNDYFAQTAQVARQDSAAVLQRQPKIPHKPYFLVVTRLIPRKNVLRLLEAYLEYRQKVAQPWDLVICGSGEEEPTVRQFIQDKHLETSVHLPGFITYQQIGDWYGLAEAFIHPALQEQWGLVVNEACAAGLPILCSHTVGACHELVHETQNGLTFDPASVEDMAKALTKMHSLDPMERIQMGKYSQEIIAQYSPQQFADGLMKAIDRASCSS